MPDVRVPLAVSHWPVDNSEPLLERTVGDALRDAAARWGDRVALVDGLRAPAHRRRWTFSALVDEAEAVARALLGRFRSGDHVAVWAANSPEWLLLEFGAAFAGLTLVTVNPAYLAKELGYVLRQSRAVGLFVMPVYRERSLIDVVAQVRPELPLLREVISLGDCPLRMRIIGKGVRDIRRRFGLSEADPQLQTEHALGATHELDRHRRAAERGKPPRGKRAPGRFGALEHRDQHRGH